MTLSVVENLTINLVVLGVKLSSGQTVQLGEVPLTNPEEREEIIASILSMIVACRRTGEMVTMRNLTFDPTVFDYYVVENGTPQ